MVLMRIGARIAVFMSAIRPVLLEDLADHGVVAAFQAEEMLALTQLGLNRITADDQQYRFMRSVRYIADRQVVVLLRLEQLASKRKGLRNAVIEWWTPKGSYSTGCVARVNLMSL